ncbi:MAG: hypothetical protein V3T17_16055 [Pseudomonadales bacterium]
MDKTLMFTVAINGYQRIFSENIESHKRYAQLQGFDYQTVARPNKQSPSVAAWLKVVLVSEALKHGYDWVFFIDADCYIKEQAPSIHSLYTPDKSIYVAKGFSGNFNSGVLIVRNTQMAKLFFRTLLLNCERNVAGQDWGENGHFIFYSRFCKEIQTIAVEWNNNRDPKLQDYIRHYCGDTPMRKLYQFSWDAKVCLWWRYFRNRLQRRLLKLTAPVKPNLKKDLHSALLSCKAYYTVFQ